MVDMIKKLTGCSLEMILTSQTLCIDATLDHALIEQEQREVIKSKDLRQVKSEQSAYKEVISAMTSSPTVLSSKRIADFNESIIMSFTEKQFSEEFLDFMALTGTSMDNLQLRPFICPKIMAKLHQASQIDLLLQTTAAFCGRQSAQDLLSVPLFKSKSIKYYYFAREKAKYYA
jgi:hypothetical protein